MDKIPHPYQVEGARWLANGGTMLADEPGLGKTIQAIEACKLVGARRILIVCPAVALAVWRDEIRDCWPECTPHYVRDGELPRAEPWALITGYEYLLINRNAQRTVLAVVGRAVGLYDALVLDEAHALKNPAAKRTIMIYGPGCGGSGLIAMAKRTWLLTGTPMLNHAGEFFPHLRAIAPDRIAERSYDGYTHHYCTTQVHTIRTKRGKTIQKERINGSNRAAMPELARRLRGFWLKRKTTDVLAQLPALTINVRTLDPEMCDTKLLAQAEQSEEAMLLREALESGDIRALQEIEGHIGRLRRLLALAKVPACIAVVEDLLDQGVPKVAVWGWHVKALELVALGCAAYKAMLLHGGTTNNINRAKLFQSDPTQRVFVGQIKAGGQAIDLDTATRVVFIEQDWTPMLNYQALMRHRRAAKAVINPVLAEGLAIDGSIDQAVTAILTRKTDDINLLENA